MLTASTSKMFFSTSPVAAGLLTPFLPDCSSVPGAPANSLGCDRVIFFPLDKCRHCISFNICSFVGIFLYLSFYFFILQCDHVDHVFFFFLTSV